MSSSRTVVSPLTQDAVDALPGQLGVYELTDGDGAVLKIGHAGGLDAFGLRSALDAELAEVGDRDEGDAIYFRVEYTHAYLTRWQELLMFHQAAHGDLPAGNRDLLIPLGQLTPGSVR